MPPKITAKKIFVTYNSHKTTRIAKNDDTRIDNIDDGQK
jgi:hypothetical protein